jgi:DNA-binding SARP family transcriptional activator/WD40 repeat protein
VRYRGDDDTDQVTISVLGPLVVDDGATPVAPRDRIVLSVLAMRAGSSVPADTLADALWGVDPPSSSAKVVQGCVVRLRRRFGPNAIETGYSGYRLVTAPDDIDARRFERLVSRARELISLADPHRAAFVAAEALDLWRGDAFADLAGWEPGRTEAQRLDTLRLDTEDLRLEALLQAGRYREALDDAQANVSASPLRERRWALLAQAQYQAGRQADALHTLRKARSLLITELGLDPGPDIVALEGAILRHEPSLSTTVATQPNGRSPYRGLLSYDRDDAESFFGRDLEIDEAALTLTRAGVLIVAGPSGSGKSSLVRAGIAPSLRREGRAVCVITPGPHPMRALDAVSRELSITGCVLVVDQAEEAVTLCADGSERDQFFAALTRHAQSGPLILALRADRLGDVSAYPDLARLVERGLYLLKRMNEVQLRAAIEQPARQAGLRLEPGLVDVLVREVEGEPGYLPLLSHALQQTWERREDRTLTVAGYRASGGIRGAVAQSAEIVYQDSPVRERDILRQIMMRLVGPGEDGEPVRSRMARGAIVGDATRERLIEKLVGARLVTSNEDAVEIAHEALAREWPRLRGWLEDDVDGQRLRRHLEQAADAWDEMGRPDTELYRGARLAAARDWRRSENPALSPTEEQFLERGQDAEATALEAAHVESTRQRRANIRLRALLGGVAVLAIGAVIGAGAAVIQSGRADAEARTARAQELAASAVGAVDENSSLALLLAVAAANDGDRSVRTLSALQTALSAVREGGRMAPVEGIGWLTGSLAPDGTQLALAGGEPGGGVSREVTLFDTASGTEVWTSRLPDAEASSWIVRPIISPDGTEVLWGVIHDADNERRVGGNPADEPSTKGIAIHDRRTGNLIEMIDVGRCGGYPAAVTDAYILLRVPVSAMTDGECVWEGYNDFTRVVLFDRATGESTTLSTESVFRAPPVMSADGSIAAFPDGSDLRIVDTNSLHTVLAVPDSEPRAISGDGATLLAGREPLSVLDVPSGEVRATIVMPAGGATVTAALSSDGASAWTSGRDGVLREWNTATGQEIFSYPGVGTGDVSLGGAGLAAVTRGDGAEAMVIDPNRGQTVTHESNPASASAEVTGRRVSVSDADEVALTAADGRSLWSTDVHGGAVDAIVDPTGEEVIVSTADSRLVALDAADGSTLRDAFLNVTATNLTFVGFDTGGGLLAVSDFRANGGGDLVRLDAATLTPTSVSHRIHEGTVTAVAMSPDRSMFATSGSEEVIRIWDAASGVLLQEAPQPSAADSLRWRDDGRVTAVAGPAETAYTVDPDELVTLARASLTRGFTLTDCERFWADRECPYLADLDPARRDDTSDLDGAYQVRWNTEDLIAEMTALASSRIGAPLDESSEATIEDQIPTYTGTMTLRMAHGTWDWRMRGQGEPLCAGTYTRAGGHVRFGVERGSICVGVVAFEADVRADAETLTIAPGTFRGYWADEVPLTAKPWARTN